VVPMTRSRSSRNRKLRQRDPALTRSRPLSPQYPAAQGRLHLRTSGGADASHSIRSDGSEVSGELSAPGFACAAGSASTVQTCQISGASNADRCESEAGEDGAVGRQINEHDAGKEHQSTPAIQSRATIPKVEASTPSFGACSHKRLSGLRRRRSISSPQKTRSSLERDASPWAMNASSGTAGDESWDPLPARQLGTAE
jgi:hypothetical protein